jgi:hypothetical protein
MDLNKSDFEDFLAEGVPVHVAAQIVDERKLGLFKDWSDFIHRLFYAQQGKLSQRPVVRPAELVLLRFIKGYYISVPKYDHVQDHSNIEKGAHSRPSAAWWEKQEQRSYLEDKNSTDDSFPSGSGVI